MRCKKCAKTFRTPPHEMRKTQICSICTKKPEQKKTEKITPSAKWIGVKSKTINEYEVKSDSNKKEPQSEKMQDLKNQQIKNQTKLIQINDEIFVLNNERVILEKSIKLDKKQLDGYKEKKFLRRLIKFSMKKKKMVDHTKRFLSEKDSELRKNYLELSKKRSEQNICRIKIEEIIEKIIQIEKYSNDKNMYKLKMPRKKETLIEEAERIKGELEELKKKKKFSDSLKTVYKLKKSRKKISSIDEAEKIKAELDELKKKKKLDKINRLISDSLILIRKNSVGIYEKSLVDELMISEIEFKVILPKLLRLEDIVEEIEDWDGFSKKVLKSVIIKEKTKPSEKLENGSRKIIQTQFTNEKTESKTSSDVDKLRGEIKEIEKQALERIEKRKIQREQAPEIEKITYDMVEKYLRWKKNIDKKLKKELIFEFNEHKSLSKIYEMHPHDTYERLREHIITDLRLPIELKKIENEGGLHPDHKCALAIALYATDYFHWDDKKKDGKKIIDLAKSISEYLKTDEYINQLFQGKKIYNN